METTKVPVPTVEHMSKIVTDLDRLRPSIDGLEDVPLEFPEREEAENKRPSVEELIRTAAGQAVRSSDLADLAEMEPRPNLREEVLGRVAAAQMCYEETT